MSEFRELIILPAYSLGGGRQRVSSETELQSALFAALDASPIGEVLVRLSGQSVGTDGSDTTLPDEKASVSAATQVGKHD